MRCSRRPARWSSGACRCPRAPDALPIAARSVDYAYEVENPSRSDGWGTCAAGVTIDVSAGGTTAIVGPTGSGKSNARRCWSVWSTPTPGWSWSTALICDAFGHGALAEAAAFVPQQAFLFEDTVRGNVTLGLQVSDDQVWQALRITHADGFVSGTAWGPRHRRR